MQQDTLKMHVLNSPHLLSTNISHCPHIVGPLARRFYSPKIDFSVAQFFIDVSQLESAPTNIEIFSDTPSYEALCACGVPGSSADATRSIHPPLPYDLTDPIHALKHSHSMHEAVCHAQGCPLCQRLRQASGQFIYDVTQQFQPPLLDPMCYFDHPPISTASPTNVFETTQIFEVSQHTSTAASDLESGLIFSNAPPPTIVRMESGHETRENINEVTQCDHCGTKCHTSHMARHIKFACPYSPRTRVQCDKCDKWVSRPDALRRHKVSRACKQKSTSQIEDYCTMSPLS